MHEEALAGGRILGGRKKYRVSLIQAGATIHVEEQQYSQEAKLYSADRMFLNDDSTLSKVSNR